MEKDKYTSPDFKHCAVITIDMQNDFVCPGATAEVQGTFEIIPAIRRILSSCRTAGIPVFHAIRLYNTDGSNVDLCRKTTVESGTSIVAPNTTGAALVQQINPDQKYTLNFTALLKKKMQGIAKKEWIFYKPRWGAFYQTTLEKKLKQEKINTLIFTGCNFANCPRTSIYEASERDFKIVVIKDALSGIYDKALDELEKIGVNVMDTKTVLSFLNPDSDHLSSPYQSV